MFNDKDYIIWGKQLSQKAEKVTGLEIQHKTKVVQIIAEMTKKFDLSHEIADNLTKVWIKSYTLGPFMGGLDELRGYWLEYISKDPYSFQKTSWEDSIRRMIEDSMIYEYDSESSGSILRKFNEKHFSKLDQFKLTIGIKKKINLLVPYSLNYFDVLYAIEVIEKLTDVEVNNIFLDYWTQPLLLQQFYVRVLMSEHDRTEKHWKKQGYPFISKKQFLKISFDKLKNSIPFSIENWFREIPEFKEYINQIDMNTFQCKSCQNSVYDSSNGIYVLRCDICQHHINKEGNCIDDCNCQKIMDSEDDLPF